MNHRRRAGWRKQTDRQKETKMRPLEGIRVLDLTHMLAGPYGSMLLADLGAETIKVEPPGAGDATRRLLAEEPKYCVDGMSPYILTLARNKKSVTLDLKQEAGRELFYGLVRQSDVVISNFRPGVVERLKIDHASLDPHNPRIITCTVTGFGTTGPFKDRTAFDMVAQGYGGGMSITGEPGRGPMRAGIPIGDLGGGLFAAIGVLAALQARERTGRGQNVDISMQDGQISLLNYMATMYLVSGEVPDTLGNEHFSHVPYGVYRTQDLWVIIACVQDPFYWSLAEVLGHPGLLREELRAREARLKHRDEINRLIEQEFLKWKGEALLRELEQRGVPCGPVNTFDRALADPQVLARNMVVEARAPNGSPFRMPGNPVKLSGTPAERFDSPPRLGQHTREVYKALLNLSDAQLDGLAEQGVI
jgi:crotonobetainyl-CoA:carnitine CoA-transferase CaiB-like acyl-CoA transferase